MRRALQRASDLGFDAFNVGPELEYFLFRSASGTEPLDGGGSFDLTTLDAGSGDLSYRQLRDQALAVAAALRANGIGSGDTVAVMGPKTAEQVPALLGILAAGGDYLPIGVDRDGCFAQFMRLPESNVWRVRPGIPSAVAAIFDPLGNAMHTVMAQAVAGKTLAIVGQALVFRVARATLLRATGWTDVDTRGAEAIRRIVRSHTTAILRSTRGGAPT